MYRVKSNAIWHSLPGVVAAYQPLFAPNSRAARGNVSHGGARSDYARLVDGSSGPSFSARGLVFNGTQWVETANLRPTADQTWSIQVRFADVPSDVGTTPAWDFFQYTNEWVTWGYDVFPNGGAQNNSSASGGAIGTSGVGGMAGRSVYRNGLFVQDLAVQTYSNPSTGQIKFGRRYGANWTKYTLQSVLIASRILSPAEMWLAARQMAYCEQNPDWNAWERRRYYYYAPSAAFQAAWVARANRLIGGGF